MAARPNRPKHFIRPTESYFPLTNDFVDRILPTLNPSQAVVVLVLYRHTVGFWRDAVTMTQQQLAELSGLSLATVKRALTELRSGGWVDACTDMAGQPISWQVNWGDEDEVAQNELPPQLKMSYPLAQNELPPADPVLIDSSLKENTKERDNPPTPLPEQKMPDMEQRIDHWAAKEASAHGVILKINTGKKREALTEADSPELREKIAALIRTGSGDVTADILRLVGFGGRARASGNGMARQPFGAKLTRGQPETIQRGNGQADRPPPTAFASRITSLLAGHVSSQLQPASWEWPKIEKIWLRTAGESQKWDDKLVAFAKARPGASLAAVLLAFFDEHGNPREAKKAEAVDGLERVKAAQRAKYGSKGAQS